MEPIDRDNQIPTIIARQSKLEAIVEALAQNVSGLSNDIKLLAEYQRTKAQTNWGTIFAGVTLTILLVTGYVGLPLNALSERVDRLGAATQGDITLLDSRSREESSLTAKRLGLLEKGDVKTDQRLKAIERNIFALKVSPEYYWEYE